MAQENAMVLLNKTKQSVIQKLDGYIADKQIIMPVNYSYGNALNQAQLMLQDNYDIMNNCTPNSIAKAMLDMAILGLNPAKEQCYFIKYGSQATLKPSYKGKVAICKRIDSTILDITGRAVKDGEIFEFEDDIDGYSTIIKHQRTLLSMDSKNIVGAYATILYKDGKKPRSLIMTFDRIKKSWAMSQMKPILADGSVKPGSTHEKFSEEMCIRTVINKICGPIISHSDDGSLFSKTAMAVDIEESAAQAKVEIQEKQSSGPYIDFDTVQDADYEDVSEPVEKPVEVVGDENEVVEPEDDILGVGTQESLL